MLLHSSNTVLIDNPDADHRRRQCGALGVEFFDIAERVNPVGGDRETAWRAFFGGLWSANRPTRFRAREA